MIEPDLSLAARDAADLEAHLGELATAVGRQFARQQRLIATAESCTGGMIARALTDTAGSSAWFDSGFVTYSNHAKRRMLGVPESLLEQYGAVSEPVAAAMARGALAGSEAMVSMAVTGVAGPSGGSAQKPVGTVWFGWAGPSSAVNGVGDPKVYTRGVRFEGDRGAVRLQTAVFALAQLGHLWGRAGEG